MKSKNIGSSFGDFLKEKGMYEETTVHATKRVFAWQLAEAMKAKRISKTEMARRLKTSRTQIARLLDPENCGVQFGTMQKAAAIVGKRLVLQLEDIRRLDARCKMVSSAIDELHHKFGHAMKKLAE
jgi:DNA-binding Xre family transcriptional regulator